MSIIIKPLAKESVSKVLQFYNSEQGDKFQTNNRSLEEFTWLFLKGCNKPSLYETASGSESGDIVGTNAGIFIPMLSKNGEQILTVKSEDTLLSLDKMIGLGKRDILKELLQTISEKSKAEDASFIWGITPAKAAFKRCGFKIITQIKGSFYVTNPLKFYKHQIRKFPLLTLSKKIQFFIFAWVNYFNIRFKNHNPGEFQMRRIGFDEIDEELLLSFHNKNVITTCLSKNYLRWRILENPSPLKYGFLEFRDKENTIAAYFIFSSNTENIFFVEQFLFAGHLTDSKKIMIMKLALRYCRKQNAVMIRALGFPHNNINIKEMNLLTKAGFYFFNNREESYVVFKNLSDKEINPEDICFSRLSTMGLV